MISDYPVQF